MRSFFHDVFSREYKGTLAQTIRYLLCSSAGTVFHIITFTLLSLFIPAFSPDDLTVRLFDLSVPDISEAVRARNSMINNMLAFLVGNTVVYLMNIVWVFKPGRHSRIVEVLLFYAAAGAGAVCGTALMGILISSFHFQTSLAFALNFIAIGTVNFMLRRFVIFDKHDEVEG